MGTITEWPDSWVPYGAGRCPFVAPRGRSILSLRSAGSAEQGDPHGLLSRALQHPIASKPLAEIAQGKRSAAILIPGKARRVGTREYIPALVAELNRGGIADKDISIFLADGTHDQHLGSDMEELVGRETVARVRCLGHDAREEGETVQLGTTSFGTPVLINRAVMAAEVKILTGRIVPHYFAGYSGGRKALVPGVAGFRTIRANHKLTLASDVGIHPEVRPASLSGNPVHLDMVEGARLVRPDFCLNTVLDEAHGVVGVVAGDWEAAHAAGCRLADDCFHLKLPKPVDVLVTSAGGLPYDVNFMQSLKAAFNLQAMVRPGGAILWIAECAQGMHPGFLRWASIESDAELEAAVRADYNLTGHNSIMLRRLVRKAHVVLCSGLPAEEVRALGMHPVSTPEAGLRWIQDRVPGDSSYAVAPYANVLCGSIQPA